MSTSQAKSEAPASPRHGYMTEKDRYLDRLKRIEGQVRGVHRMVEDEHIALTSSPKSAR